MKYVKIYLATIMILVLVIFHGMDYDSILFPSEITPSRLFRHPFPSDYYDDILYELSNSERYRVETVTQLMQSSNFTDKDMVTVVLQHDSDSRVSKTFYELENHHGLRSTYYIRPNSDYYVDFDNSTIPFLAKIEGEGWEIGYHYDVLNRAADNKPLALSLFTDELSAMRLHFKVTSAASHGGTKFLNDKTLYDAYPEVMQKLGVYERYNILNNQSLYIWVTDSNGYLNINPIQALRTAPPGSIVVLNLHSDWWG